MKTTEPKIAFITGSGRRLGRQIAYAMADAGYDIVLHANKSIEGLQIAANTITAKGKRVYTVQGDLAVMDEVRRVVAEVYDLVPHLDVLVNNAGIFPDSPFEEVTEEIWNLTMNVNTKSIFFLTQSLSSHLRIKKGNVINIASTGGVEVWKNHIPYNVSKAGVITLTRALAKALAPDIRVNAVAPGIIIIPAEEDKVQISHERIPLKRYGIPKDVTDAVLFLASAQYITGNVLLVDGGRSALI